MSYILYSSNFTSCWQAVCQSKTLGLIFKFILFCISATQERMEKKPVFNTRWCNWWNHVTICFLIKFSSNSVSLQAALAWVVCFYYFSDLRGVGMFNFSLLPIFWSVINDHVCHCTLENRLRSTEITSTQTGFRWVRPPLPAPDVVDDVMVVISAVCGWSGHFGEGPYLKHCGHWQEGLFVAHWLDSGPVHVYNQETHQPVIRDDHVPVCGPGVAPT